MSVERYEIETSRFNLDVNDAVRGKSLSRKLWKQRNAKKKTVLMGIFSHERQQNSRKTETFHAVFLVIGDTNTLQLWDDHIKNSSNNNHLKWEKIERGKNTQNEKKNNIIC